MTSPSTSQQSTQSRLRSPFRQFSECRVTTAVQSFSHNQAILYKVFYSPRHFPKFLATAMICSGVAGYKSMEWYWTSKMEERASIYALAYDSGTAGNREADITPASLARKMTLRANDIAYNIGSNAWTKGGAESLRVFGIHRHVTRFW